MKKMKKDSSSESSSSTPTSPSTSSTEPKKKKTRGKKKKEEPKLPVESAAVQARAQWLEDRTRMSLALHPQFRIGALSFFRLGEAAPGFLHGARSVRPAPTSPPPPNRCAS